ncbi:MAG: hypothetical protein C7B45_08780 [Sulfobacillus acidophilus]|uniref:Uncharacterized protein n=1 Tax=Sulfobacillus acidophilus TaxID=53633 RepID=A0A2T2WIB9_9FIRM|nr:MAG: hypothetical protein C7B45_08780 [Sulfobacillus acidophilus]
MANSKRVALAAGWTAVMLSAVLTGCGVHTTRTSAPHPRRSPHHQDTGAHPAHHKARRRPPTYRPKPTTIPIESSSFPTIMVMAMSQVPAIVKAGAQAPMFIPKPVSGSTVLYYDPVTVGPGSGVPGLIQRYQVTLSSPPDLVAQFSSGVFANGKAALQNVQDTVSAMGLGYPQPGPVINVGSGVLATTGVVGAMNLLSWQEGGWNVVVGDRARIPMRAAEQVAAYLHSYVLPTPASSGPDAGGVIAVTVERQGSQCQIAWEEGKWVYRTETYPTTSDAIATALNLAVFMRPYPR